MLSRLGLGVTGHDLVHACGSNVFQQLDVGGISAGLQALPSRVQDLQENPQNADC